MKLLLVFIVISTLACGSARADQVDDFSREAAELARSAGLIPLDAKSSIPEIRIWQSMAFTDSVTGWIVRPNGVSVYSNGEWIQTEAGRILIPPTTQMLALTGTLGSRQAKRHLTKFAKLQALGGQYIHCGIKDGWRLLIEGTGSMGYFVFAAGTPNKCDSPEGKVVWKTFKALADTKPDTL